MDINKDVYDYLFEVTSDWLVLDTGCLRYRMLVNKDNDAGVTECHIYRLNCKYDKNDYSFVSVCDISENEFEKYMDEYLARILEKYDERKIIVVETYMVKNYVNSERSNIKEFKKDYRDRNSEIKEDIII